MVKTFVILPNVKNFHFTPTLSLEIPLFAAAANATDAVVLVNDWNVDPVIRTTPALRQSYADLLTSCAAIYGLPAPVFITDLMSNPEQWWSAFIDVSCKYSIAAYSTGIPNSGEMPTGGAFDMNMVVTAIRAITGNNTDTLAAVAPAADGFAASLGAILPAVYPGATTTGVTATLDLPIVATADELRKAVRKTFCDLTQPIDTNVPAKIALDLVYPAGATVAVAGAPVPTAEALPAALAAEDVNPAAFKDTVADAVLALVAGPRAHEAALAAAAEGDEHLHFAGAATWTGRRRDGHLVFRTAKGLLRSFDGRGELRVDLPVGEFEGKKWFVDQDGEVYTVSMQGGVQKCAFAKKDERTHAVAAFTEHAKLIDRLYVRDKKDRRAAALEAAEAKKELYAAVLAQCD